MPATQETIGESAAWLIGESRNADRFVGRAYSLDYETACVLVSDLRHDRVMGIPPGTFLLAFYDGDEAGTEMILLRSLRPVALPPGDVRIRALAFRLRSESPESPERGMRHSGAASGFSGIECRVLGVFHRERTREGAESVMFEPGAEALRSPSSYAVFKPSGEALELIAGWRTVIRGGGVSREFEFGRLRYRFRDRGSSLDGTDVPVTVSPAGFAGTLTGIIGRGGPGDMNAVRILMEATEELSRVSENDGLPETTFSRTLDAFTGSGAPLYPIGQVVFDAAGDFAADEAGEDGFAGRFERGLTRYGLDERAGQIVLGVNFYDDVLLGFDLARSFLANDPADYVRNFTQVDLEPPEDDLDFGARTRWARKRAAYLCCLYRAGFPAPPKYRIRFQGNSYLDSLVKSDGSIRPGEGITFQQAVNWFSTVWDHYNSEYFHHYKDTHDGREWADEDLKALLVFLTRKRAPGGNAYVSGYRKLAGLLRLHTAAPERPFPAGILEKARKGEVIVVDLSRGDPEIGKAYADIICREIFNDSMSRFIRGLPNNIIQFYFDSAPVFFPEEGAPGPRIHERIAREGRKLRLGMVYLSPDVSHLGARIRESTRNWLVSHLGSRADIELLGENAGFGDFAPALLRDGAAGGNGAVWMKTADSPFVLPVRVYEFPSGHPVVPLARTVRHHREHTGEFPGRFDHQRVQP